MVTKKINDKKEPVKKSGLSKNPEIVKAKSPIVTDKMMNKTYHVAQRKEDKKWQVKFANGEKAIKLFDTQAEAIKYAENLAKNQDGSIAIHKKDGKLRKQKY